ncbi:hypothetical protein Q7P37_007291 [Cladosporium fusiforme]
MAETADAEGEPQKTANLARIRDNQRRSRARRSEYLKDLESRYRNCEQVGVSASAEIQAAAKSVVEENRRLRNLLKAYGIPDAEIDRASGRRGSIAATDLEAMVNSRRPCGPDDGCQSEPAQNIQPHQTQPIQSTQQPSCQPILGQQPTLNIRPDIATQQFPNQIPSPCSLPDGKRSHDHESPLFQVIQQNPHIPCPIYETPVGDYQYLAPDFNGSGYPAPQPQPPHTQYEGLSSCQIAANNIRTFSPNAGYELEQELGCRAPGEECSVPNLRVFSVIDRYTGGSG